VFRVIRIYPLAPRGGQCDAGLSDADNIEIKLHKITTWDDAQTDDAKTDDAKTRK